MSVKLELNSSEIIINYICFSCIWVTGERGKSKENRGVFQLCDMLRISHTGLKSSSFIPIELYNKTCCS